MPITINALPFHRRAARGTPGWHPVARRDDLIPVDTVRHIGAGSAIRFEILCAELCAELVDETRFRVSYGEAEIVTNPAALTAIMRDLLSAATTHARKWIEMDVAIPLAGFLTLTIRDDRTARPVSRGGGDDPDLATRIASWGGKMETRWDPRWHSAYVLIPGTRIATDHEPEAQRAAL